MFLHISFPRVSCGSSFPAESFEGESWPLNLNTHTDDFDKTENKPEETSAINTTHATLQDGVDFLEKASLPSTVLLQLSHKPRLKPNEESFFYPFSFMNKKRFLLSLFLLAVAFGSGAVWLTRAPEKAFPSEDEIEQRIEKVKKLLPAAKLLAAAINSATALDLLTEAKESLSILQSPPPEEEKEENELDKLSHLNKAIWALRGLHRMAVQQAESLLRREDKYIDKYFFSTMHDWGNDVRELVAGLNRLPATREIDPFLTSYWSVGEGIEKLTKRIKAVGRRVKRQKKFEDESDGEGPLIEAANNLEWINSTTDVRKRQLDLLKQLQKSSLSVAKSYLAAERQSEMWGLDEHLGYLCMRAALAREKYTPGADGNKNYSADNSISGVLRDDSFVSPAMVLRRLKVIGGCINEIVYVAGQLQVQEQALQWASTLEELLTINSTIMHLEERAALAIEKGIAEAEHLPPPKSILNDKEKKALADALNWIKNAVVAENSNFHAVTGQADHLAEHLMKEGGYEDSPFVKGQADLVARISKRTIERDKSISKAVAELFEAENFETIYEHFKKTIRYLQSQNEDREVLRVRGQSFLLTELLLRDINNLEAETDRAAAPIADFEEKIETEKKQVEEMRKHLDGAKQSVKDAATLEIAAEAAAYFRSLAMSLQDHYFESKGTKRSNS